MDISKAIAELKQKPGFADNVGMVLVHNGTVRSWSRQDKQHVTALEVTPDQEKIQELVREYSAKPGIFRIVVEARSGRFQPGDDLLFIIVAGDVREHVKPVLSELLERIKAEGVRKREIMAGA
ncbi:Molybdopterin synthase catalytic subunit [Desulfonatronum thiosulfatophilum]|uniref:Molybdopterin synthase catalytic subunit n=1 Tax=Desulfonatronum thiosulfatophilum TaxID=617002 RepID=A0A1G6AA86_9BACT|nr:molybdenum cofactor biosynthesis protein MoaE [Desulfonatronum thiosulfatophilum]SDB05357.1 Molybdopterin synthase catalytic subunit [Desulfonatronum thiosulfatophilum]